MVNIRKLKNEDIPFVVDFHRKAIGYSLNARLGQKHLERVYECVSTSDLAIVNVAEADGKIFGVVSATTNSEKLSSLIIKSLSFKQRALLGINLVIRPWLYYNVWELFRLSPPVIYKNTLIRGCLTAIAVASEFREKGIGKALIGSVNNYFKSKNINYYRLDTYKTNINAMAFYKKLGFVEAGQKGRNIILIKETK